MSKVTLDRGVFKALASNTRLEILKSLNGKSLSLNEISRITNLNKATLHEHLSKLNDVGLVKKKSREGHKWVYYKLTWKGESLLHPENTRIVILFTSIFFIILVCIIIIFNI
jgi:DNA-binding transcriptional ArsR family regulator